jgi:hypothetical protein
MRNPATDLPKEGQPRGTQDTYALHTDYINKPLSSHDMAQSADELTEWGSYARAFS